MARQLTEVEAAELRGYLRGLHDAWHNTHIVRFDTRGGITRDDSPHGTVDDYYGGITHAGIVIGQLWRNAGRTDSIGGNCYAEFPVTQLREEL
jgi:hypothetical protein